jgi:hypothetical protein
MSDTVLTREQWFVDIVAERPASEAPAMTFLIV